jgi:hypothetical protein
MPGDVRAVSHLAQPGLYPVQMLRRRSNNIGKHTVLPYTFQECIAPEHGFEVHAVNQLCGGSDVAGAETT